MSFNASSSNFASGIDLSSLSWLEKKWVAWYLMIGNHIIATGLLAVLVHEVAYFGRCMPWVVIDRIPYFNRWKLQPNKTLTSTQQWECTKHVLKLHFVMDVPLFVLAHTVLGWLDISTTAVPFTPLPKMALQIACFFIWGDIFHYAFHRTMHTPWLYKRFHKVHHEYSAPFGIAAEYGHPIDIGGLSLGAIAGPLLYGWVTKDVHLFTLYLFASLRLWQVVDSHSGYDFPWSLNKIVPFWAGAEHHDFHHLAFTNNFGSTFRWCDFIFGTDKKYRAYRARMSDAQKKLRDEHDAEGKLDKYEKKLLSEVEGDGLKAEYALVGKDIKND